MVTELTLGPELWRICDALAQRITAAGGRVYLVGGCTRDAWLGLPVKDIDIEVFGMTLEQLEQVLRPHHELVRAGKSFGVLKLRDHAIDIAVPRKEAKVGKGHCGFEVECDPSLSLEAAAARRDFTVNTIYWDWAHRTWEDPYGGIRDLERRCLRHTSPAFSEDPLRVLRCMQFAGRFEMSIAPETLSLCRTITLEGLSRERIFEEWKKLLLKAKKPSLGLFFLRDCGWIRYFPEIQALVGCPQDPHRHPEGDVLTHTALALDYFAQNRLNDPAEDLLVGFATLCHDFGKPSTTTQAPDGTLCSIGHDTCGVLPAETFLSRLSPQRDLLENVPGLVREHMRPGLMYKAHAGDPEIRRLACRVRIDRLLRVASADIAGRPRHLWHFQHCEWLAQKATELGILHQPPTPIIQGRHLLEHGLSPSEAFGNILKTCFEAQLDGAFSDEATGVVFLEKLL